MVCQYDIVPLSGEEKLMSRLSKVDFRPGLDEAWEHRMIAKWTVHKHSPLSRIETSNRANTLTPPESHT